VSLNPNTPLDVLRALWLEYPECLLKNPVLTLEKGSVPRIIAFFEPPIRPFNPSHDRSTEMRFLKLRQYAGLTPLLAISL